MLTINSYNLRLVLRFLIFLLITTASFNSLFATTKILRWAADAEGNAPYIFQNPNNPREVIGFEVDIVKAIAEYLGYKEVFFQNQWDGLIPGLQRNDYDIAINGIEITEDRKKEVNFTEPYYITFEQIVVRSNEHLINSFEDLIGKKVGALKSSLAERILSETPGINVLTYEGEVYSFSDLANGRIDAVLVDAPIALYYASWNPQFKLVGQPVGEVKYGIALRKLDKLLTENLNDAIRYLINSGKLKAILESWNLWNYQMALYTNDMSPTTIRAEKFEDFVADQRKEGGLMVVIGRYVNFLPLLGQGALITIGLSVLSMLLAIVVGLIIALIRVYAPFSLSFLAMLYIEVIRGTPLLIQLFMIFYALPSIGIKLSPFVAAVLGLGLNYAAYEAENYRAGLFSVPKGQMEAALSLGMSKRQALRYVILPQAIRLVIPPITNDFISLLKDSSLVSVITMVELTKVYTQISATYYDYLGTGIIVAIIYLLIGLPFIKLSKMAEKHFSLENAKRFKGAS